MLESKWILEFLQINQWIKEHSPLHVEISSQYEKLQEKKKAEKKQRVEGYEQDYEEDSQMQQG